MLETGAHRREAGSDSLTSGLSQNWVILVKNYERIGQDVADEAIYCITTSMFTFQYSIQKLINQTIQTQMSEP